MSSYFLDSSALIKRYITELGTNWVRALLLPSTKPTVYIAQITSVEMASAIARRKRDGTISLRTGRATQLLIERHTRRQYLVLGLSVDVVNLAKSLVDTHILRAYDAVQLATALELNKRLVSSSSTPFTFVSADIRLLSVANVEGLATDNPDQYP